MSSSTSSAAAVTASPPDASPSRRSVRATGWIAVGAATATTAAHLALQAVGVSADAASAVAALTGITVLGARISAVDVREHRIPNQLTVILAAALVGATHHALLAAAVGALAMVGAYLVVHVVGRMGFGDVKLAAACGLALGVQGTEILVLGICAGFFLALPAAALHVLRRRGGKVAFGPWLLAGTMLGLVISLFG